MNEQEMIFPEYMKDFACIGPACTDSCCMWWRVDIDKATFRRYKNYKGDTDLRPLFETYVKRNRRQPTEQQYAKIKMKPGGFCPFLDQQSLCLIHRELGPDALSAVCQLYPRKYARVNRTTELSATLSCPEIARKALLNPQGLSFVSEPLPVSSKMRYNLDRVLDVKTQHAFAIKYFYDVQMTGITILQYRPISVERRMMILGIFSKKLFDLFSGKEGRIEKILRDFYDQEILDAYAEGMDQLEGKYMAQLLLLREMSMKALGSANRFSSKSFVEYQSKALLGLFGENRTNDEILLDYQNIGLLRYRQWMEEKSYILENYLVNTLYEQLYPVNEKPPAYGGNDVFYSYIRLAIKFVLFRTLFIGLLMQDWDPTDENMVDLIQTYSKKMHHDPAVMDRLLERMKEEGNYSSAGAMVLVNI